MATRSSWKGILKLSLVTIPVKTYPSNATDHGTDDLSKLSTEDSSAIHIQEFITPTSLDPIYWSGATFYLVPDGPVAQRPYAVLRQAMAEQKRYAIAQVVCHGNVVLLRPMDRLIAMTILSYDHQITKLTTFEEAIPKIDIAPDELKLAKTLIGVNTRKRFDFSKYTDAFKAAESIEAKAMIPFMDALKQSVAEQTEAHPGKKLAPSKPAPSAAKQRKTS